MTTARDELRVDLGKAVDEYGNHVFHTEELIEAALDAHQDEVLRERRRAILAASLAGPVHEASAANPVWTAGYRAGLSVAADLTTPAPSDPGSTPTEESA